MVITSSKKKKIRELVIAEKQVVSEGYVMQLKFYGKYRCKMDIPTER